MKIAVIGGHLSPALAVIESLLPATQVFFVGRKYTFEGDDAMSLEYKTITDRGIKFYPLTTGRLQRKFTKNTFMSLTKLPSGFISARKILKEEAPDAVIGFGGYLSLTVCLAAKSLGIPIIIHEQTLEAGLANKIIGKFADKVCISWDKSAEYFPEKNTVLTGNPIRKEIQVRNEMIATDLKFEGGKETIYITGGSAGSHAINDAVYSCLEVLLDEVSVIHQTGDSKEFEDFDRLEAKKNSLPVEKKSKYRLIKFIKPEEVGSVMNNALIVVGRAGINTVSELIFLKKPALLIPIPFSQRQEQLKNAEMLKEIGLAEILEQPALNGKTLVDKITYMLENLKKYTINKDFMEHNNAAEKIVEVIRNVAEKEINKKKK